LPHYTKKFKTAYDRVLEVFESDGELAAKHAFKAEMIALGHDERVKNLYRIQDKLTKKATFLHMNSGQAKYTEYKAKRNIILKCRQIGFTTLNCIRGLDYALWEPNTRAGILCHLQRTVETIFNDITKFSYNWFTRDWGHLYNPVAKQSSSSTLAFESDGLGNPLESSIRVMFDFRGKTVNFLHVSEASRIDDDRLVGSLQGVPVNGEITLESTAAGQGGDFYRLWTLHRSMGSLAPYKGFFIPWHEAYPEMPDDWVKPPDFEFTAYEKSLIHDYPEQIKEHHVLWRRWCVEANCVGDSERFENEYPTNDIDCFMSGSNSVFGKSIIKTQSAHCRSPLKVGYLVTDGGKSKFYSDEKGVVSVWETPNPSKTYVMGADPAGGVGRDKGAAYVKDQETGRLVARIWCDLSPSEFAHELYRLARYYNKAYICVEANNHGAVVLHVLKELKYSNLYKRKVIDELTMKPTHKLGYLTTSNNKLIVTENFKNSARQGDILVLDRDLIQEMTTYMSIASKKGNNVRREAAPGAHDDLVMAASLTEEMDRMRPSPSDQEEQDYSPSNSDIDRDTGFAC